MIGLANLGNTCYINSVLQMLFTLKPLMRTIKYKKADNPLTNSLSILFDAMETSDTNLAPVSLKKNMDLYMPNFKDKIEHDAHEFLMGLIDFLHKNFYEKESFQDVNQFASTMYKEYIKALEESFKFDTNISKLMYSGLTKKLVCRDCQYISYKFETYLSLDMYLQNKNDTLYTCLKRYFETDYIYIECGNCGAKDRNVEHSVEPSLNKLPKYLFIMLKRFTFSNGKPSKNNNSIDIPEELDLSQFYSTLDETSNQYTLQSVICHQGKDIDTGHYMTLSKNLTGWDLFNDTKVTHGIFKNTSDIESSLPYILAYEMKNMQK
jgi:ubiquitin C-terminal hydrolase